MEKEGTIKLLWTLNFFISRSFACSTCLCGHNDDEKVCRRSWRSEKIRVALAQRIVFAAPREKHHAKRCYISSRFIFSTGENGRVQLRARFPHGLSELSSVEGARDVWLGPLAKVCTIGSQQICVCACVRACLRALSPAYDWVLSNQNLLHQNKSDEQKNVQNI